MSTDWKKKIEAVAAAGVVVLLGMVLLLFFGIGLLLGKMILHALIGWPSL